jgi:hypothetical protein
VQSCKTLSKKNPAKLSLDSGRKTERSITKFTRAAAMITKFILSHPLAVAALQPAPAAEITLFTVL